LNFEDLTFVVPYRIDCEDRRRNLKNCIRFFDSTGAAFVFVEGLFEHDRPFYEAVSYSKRARHICASLDGFFHKTWLSNLGLSLVETDFFGLLDCDVICYYDQLACAMVALRDSFADFVYPYDGKCVEVPRDMVAGFLDGSLKVPTNFRLLNTSSAGGLIMGRSRCYREIGGENENFRSWGPEDTERHNRIIKLGFRLARIDGPIFHMEHERGKDSSRENPFIEANYREFVRLANISREDLISEINNWSWRERLCRK
jgi:hypothetical protein